MQRDTRGMGAQSKGPAFEDANCKPRGEASEKSNPTDTLMWTCSVWNYEKIIFCSLICPTWVFFCCCSSYCYGNSRKLIRHLKRTYTLCNQKPIEEATPGLVNSTMLPSGSQVFPSFYFACYFCCLNNLKMQWCVTVLLYAGILRSGLLSGCIRDCLFQLHDSGSSSGGVIKGWG